MEWFVVSLLYFLWLCLCFCLYLNFTFCFVGYVIWHEQRSGKRPVLYWRNLWDQIVSLVMVHCCTVVLHNGLFKGIITLCHLIFFFLLLLSKYMDFVLCHLELSGGKSLKVVFRLNTPEVFLMFLLHPLNYCRVW